MSLPSRRPFRHTQTKESHSPEAEAATNEVIQADWCESPPTLDEHPPRASGCVTRSPSHMFFKVVPVSRGEAMLVHLRRLAQSALPLNPRWHSVSPPGGPWSRLERGRRHGTAKSHPTFSVTQSPPIRYKSFHLPCSPITSNPSKQLICLSPIRPGSRL